MYKAGYLTSAVFARVKYINLSLRTKRFEKKLPTFAL